MNLIIAVDNGNVNTKTENFVFTSGVNHHDLEPPLSGEVLKFNGKYYSLSNTRMAYMRDKTINDDTFILTLYAIAKELIERKIFDDIVKVNLAVGLPPQHYSGQKDKFRDYFYQFGSLLEFDYNDIEFKIDLESVNVYPQAYAAALDSLYHLKGFSKSYIVDIGGYTTDVLLLINNKPDLTNMYSLESGIIVMNNNIIRRVDSKLAVKLDDSHIYDALVGNQSLLNDEIKNMVFEEADKHVETIIMDLRERGVDLMLNPVIFVGGGSKVLRSALEKSKYISRPFFVDDICANAKGYNVLNNISLRRGK